MLTQALTGTFAPGANQRYASRRVLRLEAQLSADDAREGALIHNLSETGMLISATSDLAIGEKIEIALSGGKTHMAEIVWADEGLFGCRFTTPIPKSVLSAALLRSELPKKPAPSTEEPRVQLALLQQHWAMEEVVTMPATAAIDVGKLPIGKRAWAIIGLASGSWALLAAAALLLW